MNITRRRRNEKSSDYVACASSSPLDIIADETTKLTKTILVQELMQRSLDALSGASLVDTRLSKDYRDMRLQSFASFGFFSHGF